jgi:hypothetical protein
MQTRFSVTTGKAALPTSVARVDRKETSDLLFAIRLLLEFVLGVCSRMTNITNVVHTSQVQVNEQRPSAVGGDASRFIILAASVFVCFGAATWAQAPASPPSGANQSWTVTREAHIEDVLPSRTIESHVQEGNRSVDKQSVEQLGFDRHFEPYQDTETESVQVNSTTVRTITRIFGRDGAGARALVQTTEEDRRTLPSGESRSERVVSAPDSDGRLQPTRREISQTKKITRDAEETKTTVMLPSIAGELTPTMQIEERQQRTGNNTEFKKTIQWLDAGTREWQVTEVQQRSTKGEGNSRTTEERVSRLDYEGKLSDFSRTVSKESESPSGEKQSTVENYSVDMPGTSSDGSLRLIQRVTSKEATGPNGQQTAVQKVEEPNPGDPSAGLRVTSLISDKLNSGPSGAQATRTVQVRNGGGEFEVKSVDTAKSDNIHAIQVQIGPSKPQ